MLVASLTGCWASMVLGVVIGSGAWTCCSTTWVEGILKLVIVSTRARDGARGVGTDRSYLIDWRFWVGCKGDLYLFGRGRKDVAL